MKDKIIILTQETPEGGVYSGQDEPDLTKIDLSKIDNIEFDGIDHSDFPRFCDAYIISADYDGESMDADQLSELNEKYSEWAYEKLFDFFH